MWLSNQAWVEWKGNGNSVWIFSESEIFRRNWNDDGGVKKKGIHRSRQNYLNTLYWTVVFALQAGKISPGIRSSGKILKRKSLGPEISNNYSLYPTALLMKLPWQVPWQKGSWAANFPVAPKPGSEKAEPLEWTWATQEQWAKS